eukprot:6360844-Amphidinium_carterae.1
MLQKPLLDLWQGSGAKRTSGRWLVELGPGIITCAAHDSHLLVGPRIAPDTWDLLDRRMVSTIKRWLRQSRVGWLHVHIPKLSRFTRHSTSRNLGRVFCEIIGVACAGNVYVTIVCEAGSPLLETQAWLRLQQKYLVGVRSEHDQSSQRFLFSTWSLPTTQTPEGSSYEWALALLWHLMTHNGGSTIDDLPTTWRVPPVAKSVGYQRPDIVVHPDSHRFPTEVLCRPSAAFTVPSAASIDFDRAQVGVSVLPTSSE